MRGHGGDTLFSRRGLSRGEACARIGDADSIDPPRTVAAPLRIERPVLSGRNAVSEEQIHRPVGLSLRQLARLEEHVERGQLLSPERLLQAAYAHLEDVQAAHAQHPELDVSLAEVICHVLDRVVAEWDAFSPVEQSWLRGVMQYFTKSNDARPDFAASGFSDDAEVLNACLRFVGRSQWVIPQIGHS